MPTIQLPDGDIHELPGSEPDPAQSAHDSSSAAPSDPGLLGTRDPITNQPFTAHSLPRGIVQSSIDNTNRRVRFDSPSNPGAAIPGAIRTGTWRVEEDGRLVQNMLVLTLDEGPELINTASLQDIPSDSQENSHPQDGDNSNRASDESGDPQLMWYEGEEYYEETNRDNERAISSTFLPLLPPTLETIRASLARRDTTTRGPGQSSNTDRTRSQTWNMPSYRSWDEQDLPPPETPDSLSPRTFNRPFTISYLYRVTRPTVRSRPTAPTFLNAAGEIDINLIPHAPRTDLPPPPPLVPLPRLTEQPPATWFEGMSEDSRCPVLSEPDYVVEYSLPCGHALCRWCYEQICLASNQPVCPLCRRRI
ncbi:hypothetical protein HOY80DRAFT_1072587 [Tuber brumale]|nr:hypothetical protein HOY80DRAFT_1072587 [Tuber brumale]